MSTALISAQRVTRTFGGKPLFEELTLVVAEGERLALIGPNGAGKSTLMRILIGFESPDSGQVATRRDLRIGFVEQQPKFAEGKTVFQILEAAASASHGSEYEQQMRMYEVMSELKFDNEAAIDVNQPVSTLSGGWRKRLAIAVEILKEPDLLLLDEPTNHLDIDGILWLEEYLSRGKFAICFISHDRYFIERLATRVVEVNPRYPTGSFAQTGSYSDFILAREEFLAQLQRTETNLANKVRREVAWLRQGAKARTTKSKHRSEVAHSMIAELNASDISERRTDFSLAASGRQTRELIKVTDASKEFNGKVLFKDANLVISPGTRLGVIGANGTGKTTFIKTLIGQLQPDKGQIVRAPNLRIAFFDQERKQLDPNQTLLKALCGDGDAVVFQGRSIHVASWAKKFLFRTEQLSMPVGNLSGGEQARVLISRVMKEEADILFFDEPTNDLDIQTLEVLESTFVEFPGAIVLVTHDRYFMDRVATSVLGLGGKGPTHIYADYSQWEIARSEVASEVVAQPALEKKVIKRPSSKVSEQNRLREIQAIEKNIAKEEKKLAAYREEIANPAIAFDHVKLSELAASVSVQEKLIEELLAKWEEVSSS